MILRRVLRTALLCAPLTLAACAAEPTPEPTPVPTTFPVAAPEAAAELSRAYLDAWAADDYAAMHAMLDPALREAWPVERFSELHAAFDDMTRASEMTASLGEPAVTALAPEARPAEFPAPTATPVPTPDPSATADPSATPIPTPGPSIDPAAPLAGPVPGLSVPFELAVASERFGELELERALTWVQGTDGWLLRWSPAVIFPELGTDGALRLDRELGPRGRIVGAGDLVWAETRDDGVRVYPQEALAGQVIGYVSEVTADDLGQLEAEGYRAGDVVGRSGLEAGAEDLLRGTPGWRLVAVAPDGVETALHETEMVPGADVAITIRPAIQAAAQQALAGYGQAATAVVDPRSGDVWALASQPGFNPNAMTLGTTLGGVALSAPGQAQIFNKAVLAAYPGGSAMKPFGLIAALQTGVVTPGSLVTCPPTWQYGDFTFRNYMNHSLPGLVGLAEAMAFSCNTTYMPLSFEVFQASETALTDVLFDYGFGAPTGIGYLVEETGHRARRRLALRERARRVLGVRADPAVHRPGRIPRHSAPAGQRVRDHRQRRDAVAGPDPHDGHAAGRHGGGGGRADRPARGCDITGGPRLRDRYAPGRRHPAVRHRYGGLFRLRDPGGGKERHRRDRHTRPARLVPGLRAGR